MTGLVGGQVFEGTIVRRGGEDAAPAVPLDDLEMGAVRAGWLAAAKRDNTREARARDLHRWGQFLATLRPDPQGPTGLSMFAATGDTINLWDKAMAAGVGESKELAASTRARRIANVSSWYTYLIARGVMPPNSNPCSSPVVARPEVSDESQTASLTAEEGDRLIRVAFEKVDECTVYRSRFAAQRDATVIAVMLCSGLRVTEVCRARVEDLGYDRGKRVLWVERKGGEKGAVALGEAAELVDRWLYALGRPEKGWLFGTSRNSPLNRTHVARAMGELAEAAHLTQTVTPHVLRHSYATIARDEGAELGDLQDSMGHKDPKTTRRYDRARNRVDRSPAHKVSHRLLSGLRQRGLLSGGPGTT
jgi:site-specific recombinase XerD